MLSFKHFFQQRQLNEGRNITIPPEVLSAIDQNLPQIMAKVCECKKTGQRFEMDLVEFNNKYIKQLPFDKYVLDSNLDWNKIMADPFIQSIKQEFQTAKQQNNVVNQLVKIVIDPKESKQMPNAEGWAKVKSRDYNHYSQNQEYFEQLMEKHAEKIRDFFDKNIKKFSISADGAIANRRNLQYTKIPRGMVQYLKYSYESFNPSKAIGTVNINEVIMCGKPIEAIRTLLVHEIIHCIDPKLIYEDKIKDNYHSFKSGDDFQSFKKYKSSNMEIEANIGEIVQKIFDLVNNSTDYQKTKSQIETVAQQLRGAPRPDLTNTSKNDNSPFVNWMKDFFDEFKSVVSDVKTGIMAPFVNAKVQNYISPLKSDPDFDIYTKNLTPEIKRKVLERLSNAVLQARQMLEAKYKKA